MIQIGSNNFLNCPVPIIFIDRYFVLEQESDQDLFSVFTLHKGKPVFEIVRNEPKENSLTDVSKTPTGFITVGEKGKGDFLYKVRPIYRGSSIFGKIKGEETEIRITDNGMYIGSSIFQDTMIQGCEVGFIVSRDGSIAIGASLPHEARHLFRRNP